MTSYYKSLEISYDYEAYQLYAEQELEALEDEDLEEDMSIEEAVYHTYYSPDCYEAE